MYCITQESTPNAFVYNYYYFVPGTFLTNRVMKNYNYRNMAVYCLKPLVIIMLMLTVAGKLFGQTNSAPFVIPSLQRWEGGSGDFRFTTTSSIRFSVASTDARKVATLLRADLLATGKGPMQLRTTGTAQEGDIVLKMLPAYDTALGEEGYYFDVNNELTIAANTYRGLFWGTRTLLQLLEQTTTGTIPKGKATDYPAYPVRGFVLDVGRKFFSLEFLKRYVKLLAYYKMSEFQIHLNDNGFPKYFNNNWDSTYAAFRLESSTYPGLTAKDGSYTKQEFQALQRMAQDYGVTIIPEIDVPAHSLAFTHLMPELGSRKYGMDHLDISNPNTYRVVENVLKEYISGPDPVFVGKAVHIGTDEYAKAEAENFRAFTDHFIKYVQGFGKDVRAWGALTHAAGNTPVTAKDVTLNIWYNGYADPVAMKKLGYKLISTSDGYLYIVPAAGYYYDYLNLPALYRSWTPLEVGDVSFQRGDSAIVGGMFAVWNDMVGNGITAMDVHDRVFPALQVLSEKMWSSVTDTTGYLAFSQKALMIGEGPALNMGGHLDKKDTSCIVLDAKRKLLRNKQQQTGSKLHYTNVKATGSNLEFTGSNSFIEIPIEHLGHDYRVAFNILPSTQKDNAILFNDPVWQTSVQLLPNGALAFYRENYADTLAYEIPFGRWTSVAVERNKNGVSLYIGGVLQQTLKGYRIPKTAKDTMFRVQTLYFPMQQIGSKAHGFKGQLSNLEITTWRDTGSF